ncbi:MAG: alanine racemase [Pseudomonadota bacterium]
MELFRPRATIDLSAVECNWKALHSLAPQAEIAAVVKADAYGHGADRIGARLMRAGCRSFFTATLDEAVALRLAIGEGPRIFILDGVFESDLLMLGQYQLSPVLNSLTQIKDWALSPISNSQSAVIHIDTGINRLGIRPSEMAEAKHALNGKTVSMVMSHLACADEPGHPLNAKQREIFIDCAAHWPDAAKSLTNSAGMALKGYAFNLCRPGIALYGGGVALATETPLLPTITVEAPILSVFDVAAEETTGYGATYRFRKPKRLSTVAIGYADGLPRALSNSGFAYVDGVRCDIVGRVSMDLITLDVTQVSCKLAPGNAVEFIGHNANLEAQAAAAGTLGYELLTGIGPRVERVWHG